jgi:hypothetical protein
MDSMLVAFFEQTPLGMRLLRTRRRWERGLVIVCTLLFLPFVVIVAQHFWFDLQIGVWNSYLFQVGPLLPLVTVPLAAARFVKSWRYEDAYRDSVLQLRETAAADAVPHPTSDPNREQASGSGVYLEGADHLIRLGNPVPTQSVLLAVYSALALLGGVLCLAVAVGYLLVKGHGQLDLASLPWWQDTLLVLSAGVGLFLIGAASGVVRWLRRLHRAGWSEVDSLGVRQFGSQPGDRNTLAWPEVRAFFQIGTRTYCLDTGQRMLLWRVPLRHDREHAQLVKIIAVQTGLAPSSLVPQVQATYQGIHFLPWSAELRTVVIAPILALVILLSGFWPVPQVQFQVQSWTFQPLAARIHAEKPIYTDPLTSDDGNWTAPYPPGQSPSGTAGMTLSYSRAGLTLAAEPNGFEPYVQGSQVYQDAAIEVTFRSLGAMDQYDGVGLVVRGAMISYGDAGSDAGAVNIMFDQQGEWSAFADSVNSDPYAVFDQSDSAIHTGSGIWNTMLVIMQGPEYRIFANGKYVGAYYHTPVQTGPIILQVTSLSEQGAQFRNLRVYPVV